MGLSRTQTGLLKQLSPVSRSLVLKQNLDRPPADHGQARHADRKQHLPCSRHRGASTTPSSAAAGSAWAATGLHAIHLMTGIGLILYMLLWRIRRGEISQAYCAPLEVVGIYWSFVDAVWLFLCPRIYLVGRS
jgi:hypothetical protein